MRTRLRTAAAIAVFALSSAVAHAHAHLKSATPADKASLITGPSLITLEFSEGIELKVSKVTLTGPGKAAVKTGELAHGRAGDAVVEIPVQDKLAPGDYTIDWRVLSKDGHKVKGSTTFTIKP